MEWLMPSRSLAFLFTLCFIVAGAVDAQTRPAKRDPLPIPIELASGKVHVRVVIGEAEPVWFLLDSGANMTILDLSLAKKLELPLRGHMTGNLAAGGKTFQIAFTDLPPLRIGEVELPGRTVAVIDRRTQGANGHPSSGLLGADIFRALVIEVDYPGRTMTLHRPKDFDYRGSGTVLPARLDDNGKWYFDSRIDLPGGKTLATVFVLDTGARGFLTLNRPFVEKHQLNEVLPATAETTVGFGVGGEVRHHLARLAGVAIGPIRFPSPPVSFPPAGAGGTSARGDRDGLLGARFLESFRAFFDASRARLILERQREIGALPYDASGLFLQAPPPGFDTIEILGVAPDSPAAQAGLERGDRLLEVDHRPAATYGLDGVRSLLEEGQTGSGRRVEIRLERDREIFERTLVLRALI